MDDPARAERLWLAIAIATGWLLPVGGEAEAEAEAERAATPFPPVPGSPRPPGRRWRWVGLFRHGGSLMMAALFNHQVLPLGPGYPEPWPSLSITPNGLPLTVPVGGV